MNAYLIKRGPVTIARLPANSEGSEAGILNILVVFPSVLGFQSDVGPTRVRRRPLIRSARRVP
jgi:hypothetical protein